MMFAVWILVRIVVAIVSLWVVLYIVTPEALYLDKVVQGAWDQFFTAFGIVYAIVIGLLLVEVLRRFHNLSNTFQDELNAVEDIRDFLTYVEEQEGPRKAVLAAIVKYLDSVINVEWKSMKDKPKETDSDTSNELNSLMRSIHDIEVKHDCDSAALQTMVNKIADVTIYRTQRIEQAKEKLPQALLLLIDFMSVVLLIAVILMQVGVPWVHFLMLTSFSVAAAVLWGLIHDLNNPFKGLWNRSRQPIIACRDRVERQLQE
ncbi:MAG: DUF4239 domain-containing protein [Dehalococcoidia bacterium]|nr:MAG: DUF4239 domain-containing protein [Dehalococcoidia bacterium]